MYTFSAQLLHEKTKSGQILCPDFVEFREILDNFANENR